MVAVRPVRRLRRPRPASMSLRVPIHCLRALPRLPPAASVDLRQDLPAFAGWLVGAC